MRRVASPWKANRSPLAVVDPPATVDPERRYLAWLCRYRWWVVGGLAALYLVAFNGRWRIADDSRGYVYWAHQLAAGDSDVIQRVPEHFYPGLPWLISRSLVWFGEHSLFVPHLLMWATALGGLALVYLLGRRFGGPAVGMAGLVMVGVNHLYFKHAYRLLTDMPFAFTVFVLLVGAELTSLSRHSLDREPDERRRGYCWHREAIGWGMMVLGAVAMVSLRRAGWLVLAIVVVFVLARLSMRRQWVAMLTLIVVGAGVVGLLWWSVQGQAPLEPAAFPVEQFLPWTEGVTPTAMHALTEVIPKFVDEVAVFVAFGVELGVGLDWFFGPAAFVAALGLWRQRPLWAVFVGMYTATCLVKEVNPRYFLPLLPLLALGWWSVSVWVMHACPGGGKYGRWLFVAMLVLWIVPNTVRDLGMVLEQRRTPFLVHYKDGQYAGLDELGRWMHHSVDPEAVVWMPSNYAIEHLLRRRVAGDAADLKALAEHGEAPLAWLTSSAMDDASASLELPPEPDPAWRIAGIGDLDGDGRRALVWRHTGDGRNRLWEVGANGHIERHALEVVRDPVWQLVGIGDFHSDGYDDLLWRHQDTAGLLLWNVRDRQKVGVMSLNDGALAPDWHMMDMVRFDNDGTIGLFWYRRRSGHSLIRLLDGPTLLRNQAAPRATAPDWRLVGWHSFGEAQTSLMLWRRVARDGAATGELRGWLVQGGQRIGSFTYPSRGSDWDVAAFGSLTLDQRPQIIWRHRTSGKLEVIPLHPPPGYIVTERPLPSPAEAVLTRIERGEGRAPLCVYDITALRRSGTPETDGMDSGGGP